MTDIYNQIMALSPVQRSEVLSKVEAISERDLEAQYNEALNESGPVKIAGYEYKVAEALKSVDPVAYSCGFADYIGTDEDLVEIEGEYYRADDLEGAYDEYTLGLEDDHNA